MKVIKKMAKAFIVAFSIYSKLPMPRFTWESDDMKYHLCFFPWVGAVLGGAEALWYSLCTQKELSSFAFALVAIVIPILITGSFHLDGFMDTCDALHSYQDREKKLEILKDPHIGAFAVICLAAYLLLMAGALAILFDAAASEAVWFLEGGHGIAVLCMGCFLSRALSGISVVTMPGAKKKGMLQTFSDTAGKKTVLVILVLQTVLLAIGMLLLNPVLGCITLISAAFTYVYYWHVSKKQFGGITGDLAGYFVSLTELVIIGMAAIVTVLCM